MKLNLLETADLVTFTEEIVNGKLYFLCSVGLIFSIDLANIVTIQNLLKLENK